MDEAASTAPALRWDAFGLELDLDLLERAIETHVLRGDGAIRGLRIGGDGDLLRLELHVRKGGVPGRLVAHLRELRLHRGFLGCRVSALHGPLGLPVPFGVLARLLERVEGVELDPGDGIFLADLRTLLPPGLKVRITDVACRGRVLRLAVAAGEMGVSFPPLRALVARD